jgi:membrane protease YdiL (CAAX protease family)
MNQKPAVPIMPLKKRIALEAALFFSAFFLPGFLSQTDSAVVLDVGSAMVMALVLSVPQILLILYTLHVQDARALEDFGVARRPLFEPLRIFIAYLGVMTIVAVLLAGSQLLSGSLRETLGQGYRWKLQGAAQLPLALVFCIVSAYREELFFRAYLLTRMEQLGAAPALAAASSALLFSAQHVYEGWMGVAMSAVLGVFLAVIFRRTRNLNTIAAAHGMYNFTVLCLSLIPGTYTF